MDLQLVRIKLGFGASNKGLAVGAWGIGFWGVEVRKEEQQDGGTGGVRYRVVIGLED